MVSKRWNAACNIAFLKKKPNLFDKAVFEKCDPRTRYLLQLICETSNAKGRELIQFYITNCGVPFPENSFNSEDKSIQLTDAHYDLLFAIVRGDSVKFLEILERTKLSVN